MVLEADSWPCAVCGEPVQTDFTIYSVCGFDNARSGWMKRGENDPPAD
jgi:hypothetical protein